MKIAKVETFLSCPSRNFLTVRVTTDDGLTGHGDATLNGREKTVESYLVDHLAPCLAGMDAGRIEDIWNYLYKGCYWRVGAVAATAIAGIDMALWDILGNAAGLPVYRLLGGRSRDRIKVYGHANGGTIEETLDRLGELIDAGFKAVRLQCAVPGQAGTYGTLEGKKDYYALQSDRPLPPVQVWATGPYLELVTKLFGAARERFGDGVELLHDVHNRLTPIEAARLGKELEPFRLTFLEDPVSAENPAAYETIRRQTSTPLATGETFASLRDAKELVENRSIDYLRMAATHCGGITALRRIAQFAEIHGVRMAPHGPPDISPIGHAANAHLNLWMPNFAIQEFVGFGGAEIGEVFGTPLSLTDGHLDMTDAPGLGVTFDEAAAARYPYKRSYLPVCRLEDGSMWNW